MANCLHALLSKFGIVYKSPKSTRCGNSSPEDCGSSMPPAMEWPGLLFMGFAVAEVARWATH